MGKRNFQILLMFVLTLLFNNCGQGFKSVNFTNQSSTGLATPTPTPSPTPISSPTPSPAPSPSAPPATPFPTPTTGFYSVPTQSDEQATYDNVLRWTWTNSDKVPEFTSTYGGPGSSSFDVHGDSEGDDLWTHYQQYLRTGNVLHKVWAKGWRDFFVNGHYRASISTIDGDSGYSYDHMYGQGLVLWAIYENDPAAMVEAENLGAIIESQTTRITPGSSSMAYWGSRTKARHLIVATYLAHGTGKARWITLRDKLIDAWVQSPDWRAGAVGGNYFVSKEQNGYFCTNSSCPAAYDAGRRINSAFQIGLHAEALWRAYLATGRADVRAKLVDIAKWVEYYGHDPSYVNPMVGAILGQNGDLSRWHRDSDSGDLNKTGSDCVYDTSLVNSLVIGYKLTGQASMLTKAQIFFRRGTQFMPGYGESKQVSDNQVHHFVDTLNNPDKFLFEYNKGELQYNYLLFENGGKPVVE